MLNSKAHIFVDLRVGRMYNTVIQSFPGIIISQHNGGQENGSAYVYQVADGRGNRTVNHG